MVHVQCVCTQLFPCIIGRGVGVMPLYIYAVYAAIRVIYIILYDTKLHRLFIAMEMSGLLISWTSLIIINFFVREQHKHVKSGQLGKLLVARERVYLV